MVLSPSQEDRKVARTMTPDKITISRRATYIGCFLSLVTIRLLLRDFTWQGGTELHALMEASASILALFIGIVTLRLFRGKKADLYPLIGIGFLGSGLLDGYHALLSAPWFADLLLSGLPSLMSWSGVASRFFLSVSLWLSCQAWRREPRTRQPGKTSRRLKWLAVGSFISVIFLILAFFAMPRKYYPKITVYGLEELVPAVFFLLAFVGYFRKGHWKDDIFEHWLLLALIISFVSQAMFMSFSGRFFDGMFHAGHLLKNASYFFVLVGLVMSMSHVLKEEAQEFARANDRVIGTSHLLQREEARSQELVQANEVLQRELAERRRAKEMLGEAHEEVEVWILEETAQLAQINKMLQREISERKRAESELEALHGLSRQLDSTLELDDVLELALVKVKGVVGVDLAALSILDKSSGGLILRTDPQLPREQIEAIVQTELRHWISGQAAESWHPILLDSLSNGDQLSSWATAVGGVESLVCVPLKAKGTVIGHLTLASAKVGRFTEQDVPFLSSAASVVATAIDNARLYAQTKKDAEAKSLLVRELNHRVRNNLATIVGLLSMEMARKKRHSAEKALKASIERVQSLAAIHNTLAQDEFRELDLRRLVEDVAKAAVKGMSWEQDVEITVDAPPLRLPPNRLPSLALAVNELITNALKHAFRTSDAGLIQVRVTEEGEEIRLEIRDNGAGISTSRKTGGRKGVGLGIVTSLVETDLQGQFELREDNGTVATIRFPMFKGPQI